ncbi:MAG TPA: hypothetical protein VFQ40_08435 [Actinomycetota bacterium]|nr:hypothetical protein [Actinomycetota bacterium]
MTVALLIGASVFLILSFDTPLPGDTFGFRGWGLLLGAALGTAGLLIAERVPSNPIGWLLLASSVGVAAQEFATQYGNYGIYDSPGAVPAADVAAWVPEWIWIPYMVAIAFYVPLLYPDGRLLSPRLRPVLVVGTLGAAIGTAAFALAPGELPSSPDVRNPIGLEGAPWMARLGDIAMYVFIVGLTVAIVSLGIRLRRSRGDERQQLKLLLLAFALLVAAFVLGVPYWTLAGGGTSSDTLENVLVGTILENVLVVSFVAIPVAIGFAILKYRLYDIDVVIKKTVV